MFVPSRKDTIPSNLVSPIATAFSLGVLIRTRPLLAAHRQCPSGSHSWIWMLKWWRVGISENFTYCKTGILYLRAVGSRVETPLIGVK